MISAQGIMENFVHRENLKRYRDLLAQTKDEEQRKRLLALIAEEEAKEIQPTKNT
jgi:hypothetical protein